MRTARQTDIRRALLSALEACGTWLLPDALLRGNASRQLVPARVIDDLWTGGDAGAWRTGQFGASFGAMGLGTTRYRNGWYIVDGPPRLLFAMGIPLFAPLIAVTWLVVRALYPRRTE